MKPDKILKTVEHKTIEFQIIENTATGAIYIELPRLRYDVDEWSLLACLLLWELSSPKPWGIEG